MVPLLGLKSLHYSRFITDSQKNWTWNKQFLTHTFYQPVDASSLPFPLIGSPVSTLCRARHPDWWQNHNSSFMMPSTLLVFMTYNKTHTQAKLTHHRNFLLIPICPSVPLGFYALVKVYNSQSGTNSADILAGDCLSASCSCFTTHQQLYFQYRSDFALYSHTGKTSHDNMSHHSPCLLPILLISCCLSLFM